MKMKKSFTLSSFTLFLCLPAALFLCLPAALFLCLPAASQGQDEIFNTQMPQSRKAMLLIDVRIADVLSTPLGSMFFNMMGTGRIGPPITVKDYTDVERLTLFVGAFDFMEEESEFVAKIALKKGVDTKKFVGKLFPWELDITKEGEWSNVEPEYGWLEPEYGWPEVLRFKEGQIVFGTKLYCFTSPKSIASSEMIEQFGKLDSSAMGRMVFDAQVVSKQFDALVQQEFPRDEAVWQMVQWGELVNEASMMQYGNSLLKKLAIVNLELDLSKETIAKVSLHATEGNEKSVRQYAIVLHDFAKFHLQLPTDFLQKEEHFLGDVVASMANGLKIDTSGEAVQITMDQPKNLDKALGALALEITKESLRATDRNTMKQLGLALHNYHDVHRKFPFAVVPRRDAVEEAADEAEEIEEPKISWRAKILPFCEMQRVYERMDLTQSWDAKVNQFAIDEAKKMFVLRSGSLVCHIKSPNSNRIASVRDGTSNTVMLMENPNAAMTPWSKPYDLTIDDAVKIVKSLKKNQFVWVTLFDGSVGRLTAPKRGISDEDLRAIFDPADGNPVWTEDFIEFGRGSILPRGPEPRRSRYEKKMDIPFPDAAKEAPEEAKEAFEEGPSFEKDEVEIDRYEK